MSPTPRDTSRLQSLDVDLAQLRAALYGVEAPAPDEAALRAQFREAARRRAEKRMATRGGGSRRFPLAAAAAVVLAVGVALGAFVMRGVRPASEPVAAPAVAEAPPAPTGAFQPLLSAPRLSPSSSYSVVRVRIPLSAFAVVPGTMQEQSIEADLLVGEDGLARGIRFNEADASLVSVAGQYGQ